MSTAASSRVGFFDDHAGGPWVVLAGAGISAPAPSGVLSWWDFNNQVLRGLKEHAAEFKAASPETATAIAELSLDHLDLTQFSQVVSDSFAGSDWMDLLEALEGSVPNDVHLEIAAQAAAGRVAIVLTTNFDTLLESAFARMGVRYRLLIPGKEEPPSLEDRFDELLLVKLHGTIGDNSTMIDLAVQKDSGLSVAWRGWLTRTFSELDSVVLGFSGRDLELHHDYLGLFAASPAVPDLTWQTRTGDTDVPKVAELMTALEGRGRLVQGELPEFLVPNSPVSSYTSTSGAGAGAGAGAGGDIIRKWFQQDIANPLLCSLALYGLLESAGQTYAATRLGSELRDAIYSNVARGPKAALLAAHILGYIGVRELDTDPALAGIDLNNSLTILSSVEKHILNTDPAVFPTYSAEFRRNEAVIVTNLGLMHLRLLDHVKAAEKQNKAATLISNLTTGADRSLLEGHNTLLAAKIAQFVGDSRVATLLSRRAWFAFSRAGDPSGRRAALDLRAVSVAALGEYALARSFDLDLESEAKLREKHPAITVDGLFRRLRQESREPINRFDEVLYSLLDVIAETPERDVQSQLIKDLSTALLESVGRGSQLDVTRKLIVDATMRTIYPGRKKSSIGPQDTIGYTLPGLRPVIHPILGEELRAIAQERGTAAVAEFENQPRASPEVLSNFAISSGLFSIVNNNADAVRAGLYLADALDRNSSFADGRAVLESYAAIAPSDMNAAVLRRLSRSRAYESLHSDVDSIASTIPLLVANAVHLEKVIGDNTEAGLVRIYLVLLHLKLEDRDAAKDAAFEAMRLAEGSEFRESIRMQLDQLLGVGWNRA